MAAGRTRCG
ncbi:hypothetical protein EYF80_067889 [Liparis tanakae]|uniref:Uncharacterized protein n=1 Tax=Liparis tanakae TaxID=230148 RepID=A0A4Z2DZV5_9TELE|nr:hypothetical protein EYF80_067889 [Liparis tanakae]